MGFENRPYMRDPQQGGWGGYGAGGMPRISLGFPPLTPYVKYLLIINCAVFVGQMLSQGRVEGLLVAVGQPPLRLLELWRLVTFQFLHGSFGHLAANMVGLYFFGTGLEQVWGSKYFLKYYLTCGIAGGFIFEVASAFGAFQGFPLIGASAGVLGLMAAYAILFPETKVLLYFLFPIPIRPLIIFLTIGYILNVVLRFNDLSSNAGGDLCHLGGMAVGFIWLGGRGLWARMAVKFREDSRQRQQQKNTQLQYEVDRILAKVHEEGIHSLTRKEKQMLQEATQQQKRD